MSIPCKCEKCGRTYWQGDIPSPNDHPHVCPIPEGLDKIIERETQAAKSGKSAHDCDKPTGVCRDCKWWVCTTARVIRIRNHTSYVEGKGSGHCNNPEIPMCMCMKDEDRACNHCEGPAAVNPVNEVVIPEGQPILMPWNPGYAEWAKAHPELTGEK